MSEKTEKEYTLENLRDQRKVLVKAQVLIHNKFGCDDTDVAGAEHYVENAIDNIESAINQIDCKIDELTNTKVICDSCGDTITDYPHNGRPLVNGDVCNLCSHIVSFHRLLCAIDTQNVGMNFQQVCDFIQIKEQVRKELGIKLETQKE